MMAMVMVMVMVMVIVMVMAMVMVMVMVMVTVSTRVIGAISRDFERFRLWKLFRPPHLSVACVGMSVGWCFSYNFF